MLQFSKSPFSFPAPWSVTELPLSSCSKNIRGRGFVSGSRHGEGWPDKLLAFLKYIVPCHSNTDDAEQRLQPAVTYSVKIISSFYLFFPL